MNLDPFRATATGEALIRSVLTVFLGTGFLSRKALSLIRAKQTKQIPNS